MVLELFEPAFDFALKATNRPVVMAFVADWCPHCQALKPQLAAVARDYRSKVQTWAINVDHAPNLSPVFAFDGVPVLVAFHGGQPVWRQVGSVEPSVLAKMYESLVARGTQPITPMW